MKTDSDGKLLSGVKSTLETMTPVMWAGMAMVLAGTALATSYGVKRKKHKHRIDNYVKLRRISASASFTKSGKAVIL